MINYVARTPVNGSLLRNFISQHVSVHVNVEEEVDRHSQLFKGKTSDDMEIKIVLNEPLNAPIKGWIEVIGVPNAPDSIRCKEIILFPYEEGDEPFDKTAHNTLVTLLNNCKDIFASPEMEF